MLLGIAFHPPMNSLALLVAQMTVSHWVTRIAIQWSISPALSYLIKLAPSQCASVGDYSSGFFFGPSWLTTTKRRSNGIYT